MKKSFWEDLSENYEEEVFSVLHNDKNKVIQKCLNKYVPKDSVIADYGCGIGHFIPVLSKRAKHVYAYDISQKNIDRAQERHRLIEGVTYEQCDLSKGANLRKVDCAFSVNMLIMPSMAVQECIIDAMIKVLRKGAVFFMVVPSLESALYSNARLREWNRELGMSPRASIRSGFPVNTVEPDQIRCQGILSRTGAPTKFYLKEELQVLIEKRNLCIECIKKVEYDWDSEFEEVPDWLGQPYPWDWLLVARKQ